MSKFCPNCGTELPDDAMFCGDCGAQIDIHINTTTNINKCNTKLYSRYLLCLKVAALLSFFSMCFSFAFTIYSIMATLFDYQQANYYFNLNNKALWGNIILLAYSFYLMFIFFKIRSKKQKYIKSQNINQLRNNASVTSIIVYISTVSAIGFGIIIYFAIAFPSFIINPVPYSIAVIAAIIALGTLLIINTLIKRQKSTLTIPTNHLNSRNNYFKKHFWGLSDLAVAVLVVVILVNSLISFYNPVNILLRTPINVAGMSRTPINAAGAGSRISYLANNMTVSDILEPYDRWYCNVIEFNTYYEIEVTAQTANCQTEMNFIIEKGSLFFLKGGISRIREEIYNGITINDNILIASCDYTQDEYYISSYQFGISAVFADICFASAKAYPGEIDFFS